MFEEVPVDAGDFNTSHVSINHDKYVTRKEYDDYFNTSHVSINHPLRQLLFNLSSISIHLMFLLISSDGEQSLWAMSISIHLMFLLILLTNDT